MSFYRHHIGPRLVNFACSRPLVTAQRRLVVPRADGVVVEIGFGSGLNLPFYDRDRVKRLIGINPPDGLPDLAQIDEMAQGLDVELLLEGGEAMSLPDATADTLVITYTMCSIPDIEAAISEMRRILKPGGRLLFCEHGRSNDASTARWQDRLTPLWRPLGLGCHLNRNPVALLQRGGFTVEDVARFPLPGVPDVVGFHHVGSAVRG